MTQKTKLKSNPIDKNQKGFTLIEVLIVTIIIALTSIALTVTAKNMVMANLKLRFINNIQQNAQEFNQYFTKVVRMSSSRLPKAGETPFARKINNADKNELKPGAFAPVKKELTVIWRRQAEDDPATPDKDESNTYENYLIKFDKKLIEQYFPNMTINSLRFYGGGHEDVNRTTLVLVITAGPNNGADPDDPLSVTIPIQTTVSFRDF
ncbi:MAG: prepilin-type N-terminal cleavage/methylation domain-containing protein [Candidatus Moranbacteria bacterium]|nr:prepilin-type N-terminal cleavage/methylation domain-containing protein [Candidatus Moranbacteria bacterium]